MKARDIMSTPAVSVTAVALLSKARDTLRARGFSALPVVDRSGTLLGVVSEADLIRNRFAGAEPLTNGHPAAPEHPVQTVGQVMTSPPSFVDQEASLEQVADIMLSGRRRSLPVVDGTNVVGVISRSDILRCLASRDGQVALDIRRSLRSFGDPDRWSVNVSNGDASIFDDAIDRSDHSRVLAAVEAVPGVRHVTLST